MREGAVLRRICAELERRGAWFFKTHGSAYGRRGIPDVVGAYRGRALAIEVKAPGRPLTPIQRHELGLAERAGVHAIAADGLPAVHALLDRIEEETA